MPVPLHTASNTAPSDNKASTTTQTSSETTQRAEQAQAPSHPREKSAAELEAERMYEEAMEEEYAKREGGA